MQVGYVQQPDLNDEAVVFRDAARGEGFEIQRALEMEDQDRAPLWYFDLGVSPGM